MMRADFSDMNDLARDFQRAPAAIERMAIGAANRQADAMVQDAQSRISGHASIPYYPQSIQAEVTRGRGGVSIDLGVDKGAMQGPLWNILEFGTSKNAPIPHLNPAADAGTNAFATSVGVLAERALGR